MGDNFIKRAKGRCFDTPQKEKLFETTKLTFDPARISTCAMASALWPTVAESHKIEAGKTETTVNDEWEFLSPVATMSSDSRDTIQPTLIVREKTLPHCVSTPDFGQFEICSSSESSSTCGDRVDDNTDVITAVTQESSVVFIRPRDRADDNVTTATAESSVVVIEPPSVVPIAGDKAVNIRRVPSFKDAVLLNSQEKSKEEQLALKQRAIASMRKKPKVKPKFVVQEIRRCAKSTGDLRSLARIEDDEDENDEDPGACDGEEFYARKQHGDTSWKNGLKIRPDEAKRKAMIICKKDAQRARQPGQRGR